MQLLNLRELRENRGWSQKFVADAIDKSPAAYSFYETERREPDIQTVIKLADLFKLSVDVLLGHTPLEDNNTKIQLTKDELSLIKHYRNLSRERKEQLKPYILFLENEQDKENKKGKDGKLVG